MRAARHDRLGARKRALVIGARVCSPRAMSPSKGALEQQLELEVLHSTRLRQTIIAVGFSIVAPAVLGFMYFGPAAISPATAEVVSRLRFIVGLTFVVVIAYGFGTRALLARTITRGGRMPRLPLLAGAALEVTLVTTTIFVFARVSDPLFAISAPPTYLYPVFILLSVLELDWAISVVTGVLSGLAYVAIALFVLADAAPGQYPPLASSPVPVILKGMMLMALGGIAALVGTELRRRLVHALGVMEEKNHAIETFGRHVSPAVAQALLNSRVELRGELRHVCVMFLDIRDFTRFSEQRPPQEVLGFLDTLFEPLVSIVSRHGGIVNKFLGDGFMAVFGAPIREGEPCRAAVRAALEIVAEVEGLTVSGKIPPTRIGIGLHAGEAVTGTVGSSSRKEYTVLGDTVNLAARIEQLTKTFGAQLLVSDSVWAQACDDSLPAEALPPVAVKGREAPVRLYKLA